MSRRRVNGSYVGVIAAMAGCLGVVCVLPVPALADWDPGDGHKMHYPKLPKVDGGWGVSLHNTGWKTSGEAGFMDAAVYDHPIHLEDPFWVRRDAQIWMVQTLFFGGMRSWVLMRTQ